MRVVLLSAFALILMALTQLQLGCGWSGGAGFALENLGMDPLNLSAASVRPFPDTSRGVHVFSDQLPTGMSDEQMRFSATRYAGTQKMLRADADRLHAISPNFVVLHYRLGLGLGYRVAGSGCEPTGDWLAIIEGNDWVHEYPGTVQEIWFYHYPEESANRVYNCDWGWYLMNLDDSSWRSYWQGEVLRQVHANDDDGVFMDSLSVPNYMGYDHYDPNLPAVDEASETAWSNRISGWLSWLQTQPIGGYYIIPNVGSWINSRDRTDYSPADGVMVEGFAIEADASPYPYSDWQLQMNRVLGLVVQDKVVIGQSYVSGNRERMFVLGTYLLVKDTHTFLNIVQGEPPEWYPEYDIPIGAATQSAGSVITNLYDSVNQVYRRTFDNGFVLLNAQDSSGTTVTVNLGGTYYLAQTRGGGTVSPSGTPTGEVTYRATTQVTLPPYSAAVLLNEMPNPMSSTTTGSTSTSSSSPGPTSMLTTSTTMSSAPTSSSTYFESTSATTPQSSVPGFQIEAIVFGAIIGLFVLSLRRLRKKS
jgi:hypothetical protein